MSIQAGWNNALVTIGALGHFARRNTMENWRARQEMSSLLHSAYADADAAQQQTAMATGEAGVTSATDPKDIPENISCLSEVQSDAATRGMERVQEYINDAPSHMRAAFQRAAQGYSNQLSRHGNDAYARGLNRFIAGVEGEEIASPRQIEAMEMARRALDAGAAENFNPDPKGYMERAARAMEREDFQIPEGEETIVHPNQLGGK